ncbi:hypothetical protein [Actinomadura nitritigenes]|uniref:hypothetical protein n=1 Tax=Actinomadura nitritigenes TaxID=134602 RepID=UPI003D8D2313
MPDEPSLGEVARRLERMEARQEELWRELTARKVDAELYQRDRREDERRFTELERDLISEVAARKAALDEERKAREKAVADERAGREAGDKAIVDRLQQTGTNWRQVLFSGLLPSLFFIVTIAVTVLLALRSGK